MAEGDVYESQIWFTFQGDTQNIYTYHFLETNSPATEDSEDELNFFLVNVLVGAMLPQLSDQLTFNCSDTKKIWDGAASMLVSSVSRQLAMDLSGIITPSASLPGQCSMLVQLLGDLDSADPKRRGRDYYTGFVETDQADGIWVEGTVDTWLEMLQTFLIGGVNTQDGGAYDWVIFSNSLATAAPPDANPQSKINFLRAWKRVRTQRRRQALNPCDKYYPVRP